MTCQTLTTHDDCQPEGFGAVFAAERNDDMMPVLMNGFSIFVLGNVKLLPGDGSMNRKQRRQRPSMKWPGEPKTREATPPDEAAR